MGGFPPPLLLGPLELALPTMIDAIMAASDAGCSSECSTIALLSNIVYFLNALPIGIARNRKTAGQTFGLTSST